MTKKAWLLAVAIALALPLTVAAQLDDTCMVSALNRTAPVQPGGTWVLPNVPANLGMVRVRATCVSAGSDACVRTTSRPAAMFST